jgi:hypothetical protein
MPTEENFDPNNADLQIGDQEDFTPIVRKQEQLRTTIGRVVQNDPLAAKRFQDLVGRALSKRLDNEELL